MKTTQFLNLGVMLLSGALLSFGGNENALMNDQVQPIDNVIYTIPEKPIDQKGRARIQVALLLDTSSSMDGLIDQAKSRLWSIINTLTTLRYHNQEPIIEIALYEYGNSGLSESSGWIRQVLPLTTNLDLLSQSLFSLTTYGGDEFCGQVIGKAVQGLAWSQRAEDMRLIYIAGNEPFDQGKLSYQDAIASARNKNIYINTIHCGDMNTGINSYWQKGAQLGNGKFFNINSDRKIRYIETPYDDKIADCNIRLNATYISYGSQGQSLKDNQVMQDQNAAKMSKGNSVERSLTKSKKSAYNNKSWDLVDVVSSDEKALESIPKSELPAALQNKSTAEIKVEVSKMEEERARIQEEMNQLGKNRQAYIDDQMKNSTEDVDDLGNSMTSSIMELALKNGYKKQ